MPKHQDSKYFPQSTAPKPGGLPNCLPASVGMTQAPMWRAQAASIAVSHNSSKSAPRYKRSVSSSSPLIGLHWNRLEVSWCVIGWAWSRWKKNPPLPFPPIPAVQQDVILCVLVYVHTVHACLRVCETHSYYTNVWVCVFMLTDLTFCTVWRTSTDYLIQHEAM